jgi:hypothetical protein
MFVMRELGMWCIGNLRTIFSFFFKYKTILKIKSIFQSQIRKGKFEESSLIMSPCPGNMCLPVPMHLSADSEGTGDCGVSVLQKHAFLIGFCSSLFYCGFPPAKLVLRPDPQ